LRPSCPYIVLVTNIPNCTAESVSCRLGQAAAVGGHQDIASEAAIVSTFPAGDLMGCIVPWAQLPGFVGGSRVIDFYVTNDLITRGPLSGSDDVPPTVIVDYDRAPDAGFGRIYVAPGGVVPPTSETQLAIEWIDVSEGAFLTNITYTGEQNRIIIYNWTHAGGPMVYEHSAKAEAGTVNITIRDGNGTMFSCECSSGQQSFDPAPGVWNISLLFTDFIGNVAVAVTPEEAPPAEPTPGEGPPEATPSEAPRAEAQTPAETNDTVAPAEDAPAAGVVLLSIGLVSVAFARRRRA
jgi:hypothetical protein